MRAALRGVGRRRPAGPERGLLALVAELATPICPSSLSSRLRQVVQLVRVGDVDSHPALRQAFIRCAHASSSRPPPDDSPGSALETPAPPRRRASGRNPRGRRHGEPRADRPRPGRCGRSSSPHRRTRPGSRRSAPRSTGRACRPACPWPCLPARRFPSLVSLIHSLLAQVRRLSLRWFEPNTCHQQARRSGPVRWTGPHALRERSGIAAPRAGLLGS